MNNDYTNMTKIIHKPIQTLKDMSIFCEALKFLVINLSNPDHPIRRLITEGISVLERIPYTREELK